MAQELPDSVPTLSTENIRLLCAWKRRVDGPPERGGNTIGLRVPPLFAQVNKLCAAFHTTFILDAESRNLGADEFTGVFNAEVYVTRQRLAATAAMCRERQYLPGCWVRLYRMGSPSEEADK